MTEHHPDHVHNAAERAVVMHGLDAHSLRCDAAGLDELRSTCGLPNSAAA